MIKFMAKMSNGEMGEIPDKSVNECLRYFMAFLIENASDGVLKYKADDMRDTRNLRGTVEAQTVEIDGVEMREFRFIRE